MGKYFTLKELTNSTTAIRKHIKNIPDKNQEQNLIDLIDNILDPLREAYGKPIIVSSGFRSKELNAAIGGVNNSQHMQGYAADIRTVEDTPQENKKLFDIVQELKLPYDQLIDEYNYNWIHVSYSPKNRKQILHIK